MTTVVFKGNTSTYGKGGEVSDMQCTSHQLSEIQIHFHCSICCVGGLPIILRHQTAAQIIHVFITWNGTPRSAQFAVLSNFHWLHRSDIRSCIVKAWLLIHNVRSSTGKISSALPDCMVVPDGHYGIQFVLQERMGGR
jgi:hypothetical protein